MGTVTREAIEKLPESVRHQLEQFSDLIAQARIAGRTSDFDEYRYKTRGMLIALRLMQTITESELRALYLYYVTTRTTA